MKEMMRAGTRKSKLAIAQTDLVIQALQHHNKALQCEKIGTETKGDRLLDRSLVAFGGKGVFIEEFEQALLDERIDFAVHSAKDMPMKLAEGLEIAAVLPRGDVRDVLVWNKGDDLEERQHIVIGTGSKRRELQIQTLYDSECKLLRGNVNTRLDKLANHEYDAIILAAAGLERLQLFEDERFSFRYLSIEEMLPAGGQGIIAIEAKAGSKAARLLSEITDAATACRLALERYCLKVLDAGCHEPIGVYADVTGKQIILKIMYGVTGKAVRYEAEENVKDINIEDIAQMSPAEKECLMRQAYQLADHLLESVIDSKKKQ